MQQIPSARNEAFLSFHRLLVFTLPSLLTDGPFYCPLLGMFYHTHKLTEYSIVRLVEFGRFSLGNISTAHGQV